MFVWDVTVGIFFLMHNVIPEFSCFFFLFFDFELLDRSFGVGSFNIT